MSDYPEIDAAIATANAAEAAFDDAKAVTNTAATKHAKAKAAQRDTKADWDNARQEYYRLRRTIIDQAAGAVPQIGV